MPISCFRYAQSLSDIGSEWSVVGEQIRRQDGVLGSWRYELDLEEVVTLRRLIDGGLVTAVRQKVPLGFRWLARLAA